MYQDMGNNASSTVQPHYLTDAVANTNSVSSAKQKCSTKPIYSLKGNKYSLVVK